MEITKEYLLELKAKLETNKAQAIATVNQTVGAIALVDSLINALDNKEKE